MGILLAGSLSDAEWALWEAAFHGALPGEPLWRSRDQADRAAVDVAFVANPLPGALQGLPGLRLIQSLWAGVDRLLSDPTLPPDVPVARMVDPAMNLAMAETALWAVLGLHRGFFTYARQQRAVQWQQLAQRRADEVTVLLLGLGQMGGAVAQRLAAQGYAVSGWSRRPATLPGVATHTGDAALADTLAEADIVVNLLPLTPATTGFFDARRLAGMARGAGLVNLARGAHVVEADLLAALDAGQVGHAVLDVFQVEPLPPLHPFWRHDRITVLPHAAALTDPRSAARVAAANVRAVRCGQPPAHAVDLQRGY